MSHQQITLRVNRVGKILNQMTHVEVTEVQVKSLFSCVMCAFKEVRLDEDPQSNVKVISIKLVILASSRPFLNISQMVKNSFFFHFDPHAFGIY